MDNRIRIREAVQYAKKQGIKINKKLIACKVFMNTSEQSAYVRFNNYERGKSGKMNPVQIRILCNEFKVDANYLFGVKPMSNTKENENGEEKPTSPSGSLQR